MTWKTTNTPKGDNKLYSDAKGIPPSLDLRFASEKNLLDYTTGKYLIDFERSVALGGSESPGTYVDSDGFIKLARVNYINRSEDFAADIGVGTFWAKNGIGFISTSNDVISPYKVESEFVRENGSNVIHSIDQNLIMSTGTDYTFSVYAKEFSGQKRYLILDVGSGNPTVVFDLATDNYIINSSSQTNVSANSQAFENGWRRVSVSFTNNTLSGGGNSVSIGFNNSYSASLSAYQGDNASGFYLWGAQFEVGLNASLYIKTTSEYNAAPRFDHDPTTGESLGLLIEESRTNLTKYSEFQTTWGTFNTTISHNYSSPDGQSNAILLAEAPTNTPHYLNRNDVSVTVGTTYCLSVYYKKGTGATAPQWIELSANAAGFGIGTDFTATFDIENGVKGSAGVSIIDFNIIDTGNGWYRCWMTAIATATTTATSLVVKFNNNQSTPQGYGDYTGQTTSNVFVFGAQLEEGSFPTSYIPTTGTALTRSADAASITGSNFSSWYNQSEGTVFFDQTSYADTTGIVNGQPFMYRFNDLSNFNRIQMYQYTNNGNFTIDVRDSANFIINAVQTNRSITNIFKSAVGYKTGDSATSLDGSIVTTSSVAYSQILPNRLDIGIQNYNGTISRLTYFPDRLPDATLQAITS